jgi:hypothetical protein
MRFDEYLNCDALQFAGPFGSEDRLLQLAHQLGQVQPWFGRLPAAVTGEPVARRSATTAAHD